MSSRYYNALLFWSVFCNIKLATGIESELRSQESIDETSDEPRVASTRLTASRRSYGYEKVARPRNDKRFVLGNINDVIAVVIVTRVRARQLNRVGGRARDVLTTTTLFICASKARRRDETYGPAYRLVRVWRYDVEAGRTLRRSLTQGRLGWAGQWKTAIFTR